MIFRDLWFFCDSMLGFLVIHDSIPFLGSLHLQRLGCEGRGQDRDVLWVIVGRMSMVEGSVVQEYWVNRGVSWRVVVSGKQRRG